MSLEFERAIEEASQRANPREALEALGGEEARDRRRQLVEGSWDPSWRIRYLLGGIYLRAGLFDEVVEVLAKDADMEAAGAADALIVNPIFRGVRGHYHNGDLFYRRLLEKAGLAVLVVGPGMQLKSEDETGSRPALVPIREKQLFPLGVGRDELRLLNDFYAREFQRVLPASRPRLVVVPTTSHIFIEGLANYLSLTKANGPTALLLGVLHSYWASVKTEHRFREPFREAFRRLAAIDNLRVAIVVETEALAAGLREFADLPFETIVMPFVGRYFAEARRADEAPQQPVVVGFVGETRMARGAEMISGIAKETLARRAGQHVWRAQLDLKKIRSELGAEASQAAQRLASEGAFAIAPPRLNSSQYYQLLRSIDIMVLPYGGIYANSPSGVAAESLAAGCVLVVPKGSTMAAVARACEAGFVTFRELSVEAVAKAVIDAIDRYDILRDRARKAAARFLADGALQRIERFIHAA